MLARRAGALGKARPLGPALSLFLGRRDLFPAPDGAVHPGHHRRRPVGPQGTAESPTAIEAPSRGASCCSAKRRGLEVAPELASETERSASGRPCASHGTTREQRCWLQRPQRSEQVAQVQAKAKGHLQDIWLAETKDRAEKAFASSWRPTAPRRQGHGLLAKDRAGLLTFYAFRLSTGSTCARPIP